jgi:hypothetical protein
MSKRNFLLGKGERLTSPVIVKTGPPDKVPAYTVAEARRRLGSMASQTSSALDKLPADACPDDRAVAAVTLNPEYIAKSFFPGDLLRALGLEQVGSRPRRVKPEQKSKGRTPEEAMTTELFVAGPRSAFRDWERRVARMDPESRVGLEIVTIEEVRAPTPASKIKGTLPASGKVILEVVLHSDELSGEFATVPSFAKFLRNRSVEATLERRFYSGGLCFLEIEAPAERVAEIAQFTAVRAVRQMPTLRVLRPTIRTAALAPQAVSLPSEPAIDIDIKAAIFDGGVPDGHAASQWTNAYDTTGTGPADGDYLDHGLSVTSAFLFGHIDPTKSVPRPYCNVDHYRVLDDVPGQDPRELYEVLYRIRSVLAQKNYQLINLSLGPILSVEDDDVHAWTAVLDEHLASRDTLATVAVGNTGESDALAELNRIQVPADCVNALAVGACDSPDSDWTRASYSSVGPGRSPGLIKPDLVGFGGSMQRPFLTIGPETIPELRPTSGTSFAAPSVLRLGAGVRAHFGDSMNMLAIRALLIHCSETSKLPMTEVGRGRIAPDLEALVLCGDDTVRLVYQGTISAAKYIRAAVPLPSGPIDGKVKLTATLCYATACDPHHPGNYTRAGLEPTFRPHADKRKNLDQIHANSRSFFGSGGVKGLSEEELRRDAMKWENTMHESHSMLGSSLKDPVFDIHYNSRMEGQNHTPGSSLRYALIISLTAPKVTDLYDQVVRRYASLIEPLRPVVDIPITL